MDDLTVFQPWPEADVKTMLSEFKANMHNGAEVEELVQGILCFDFLCRKSELSESTKFFIEMAIDEAHRRIYLMKQQENINVREALGKATGFLRAATSKIQKILDEGRSMDDDELIGHVLNRIKR